MACDCNYQLNKQVLRELIVGYRANVVKTYNHRSHFTYVIQLEGIFTYSQPLLSFQHCQICIIFRCIIISKVIPLVLEHRFHLLKKHHLVSQSFHNQKCMRNTSLVQELLVQHLLCTSQPHWWTEAPQHSLCHHYPT